MASIPQGEVRTPSTTRFSLRSLLLIITLGALLLAPFHWFGGLYLFSLILSAVLVSYCAFRYRKSVGSAIFVAALALPVSMFLGTIVFLLHAICNLVLCVVLAAIGVRPKTFAASLAALMLIVYGVVLCRGATEVWRLTTARDQFPFRSLVERLAFEKSRSASNSSEPSSPLGSAVAVHLAEQEEYLDRDNYIDRVWALRQLHENISFQFSTAAGFGPSRMPYLNYSRVVLEPRTPLRMPVSVAIDTTKIGEPAVDRLHRDVVYSFVEPERVGYIRSRGEVSGFEAHEVSELTGHDSDPASAKNWQVTRLELVSLLRHPEPRVYVSNTLPPMDQLNKIEHRSLNEFESQALPQLISQTDVVVDSHHDSIVMLGALRAGKTCLQCHEGERGKLLGAFSYQLTPITDTPPTQPKSREL